MEMTIMNLSANLAIFATSQQHQLSIKTLELNAKSTDVLTQQLESLNEEQKTSKIKSHKIHGKDITTNKQNRFKKV
jgi:hypothetical protein